VELARLSLSLVTMESERPFGFLDDRLVAGDSLLGAVDVAQLKTVHIDPVAGREAERVELDHSGDWRGWTSDPVIHREASGVARPRS